MLIELTSKIDIMLKEMKNNTDIIYIGTYATGTLHQMFDVAFLHTCALASSHVVCFKHKSTFKFLRDIAIEQDFEKKIDLRSIPILRSSCIYISILGHIFAALTNVFLYVKYSGRGIVVINFNNVFALHILNFLSRILKKRLWIVCHGEMELLEKENGGIYARLKRVILKNFFYKTGLSEYLYFIVLGDSIKDNLSKLLSEDRIKHFRSIDHPFYLLNNDNESPISHKRDGYLNIGLIGTLSPAKGLYEFKKFVELINSLKLDVNITIIGRINTHQEDEFLKYHNIKVTWGYLERSEMETKIKSLDYVLYFYPQDSYRLIASGAVFDAIKFNLPIISFKNDYFSYLFKKLDYPGFLTDNIEEMVDIIMNNGKITIDKEINKDVFHPVVIAEKLKQFIYSN